MLASTLFCLTFANRPVETHPFETGTGFGQSPGISTPYRQTLPAGQSTTAGKVVLSTGEVNSLVELRLELTAAFENPFDPEDISVDFLVDPASGKNYEIPAFFYRDANRALDSGKEVVTAVGKGDWRVRWAPREAGRHSVRIRVRARTGEIVGQPTSVKVTERSSPGFIRVSERDHRFFSFENGTAYFPIGANICWGGDRGTFNYDDWLPKYSANGVNYGRLWLSPGWSTFGLERTGKTEDGLGMGQFDLNNLWRLDYVVRKAAANGLNLMLTIDSYNILRDRDGAPYWNESPHNSDNGGPLRIWSDFWTSEKMDRLYRAKLRYLVGRYGAFSNVMSWEFWNEVDLTRDFDADRVQAWHQRMGQYLRSIDPYQHLISTSFSSSAGQRGIDGLAEIDYVQTHHYSSPDIASVVADSQVKKTLLGKPHYVGEIGADWQGPRGDADPKGLQIHDPLWVSIASANAGAAMPWWWDNYTEPLNLYSVWKPAAKFISGIDWPGENFRVVRPTFRFQQKPPSPRREDLVIADGPRSWEPGEAFNRPRDIQISPAGEVLTEGPISSILHGRVNHPDMTNPLRFLVNFDRPTTFKVTVSEVSGYGGAALRILLDGIVVADKAFPDPDGNAKTTSITAFNGTYSVTVPKGSHHIVVENPGADWVAASYRFTNVKTIARPALQGWVSAGDSMIIGWVRRAGRTWQSVIVDKTKLAPTEPSYLNISGLASGTWLLELWNTTTGDIEKRIPVEVKASGRVDIPLPAIATDLAFKLRRAKA